MAIAPSARCTRVLATEGPGDTLLKARLGSTPEHPRALPALMEALAMWQGRRVCAALVVDVSARSSMPARGWATHDVFGYQDTPLYTLDLVAVGEGSGRRKEVVGLGDFRDLHRLLHREVAR